MNTQKHVAIVGGGLAGVECALALANAGIAVRLFEMKPVKFSPAHESEGLAELVCSNSLRSDEPEAAVGMLKQEMRTLGSVVMEAAQATRVPAGKALAVDREEFSAYITKKIEEAPLITVLRQEVTSLKAAELQEAAAVVLAAGPLASEAMSQSLAEVVGHGHLYFYDAIAPIITADSVDMKKAFWGSRYKEPDPEDKDYLNCPMNEEEYGIFYQAILDAAKVPSKDFEKEVHFEGCMPIEALAERGPQTLTFGSLKPVGFTNPHTGEAAHAILQLRAENRDRTTFNLVGCQTKLTYAEQKRVFRLVPGLENAEFVRLGSVHRNTFVNAPKALGPDLQLKSIPGTYLAGQITGVEGYVESAACGLWLGLLLAAKLKDIELAHLPDTSALGALMAHLQRDVKNFQPSNVNFGLMPALNKRAPKRKRKELYAQRTREAFEAWMDEHGKVLASIMDQE